MNNYSQFMSTPEMQVALRNSSVSADDARLRGIEYAKMFSRNEDMFGVNMNNANLLQKTFSGYSETPLLSTQYFNASVASYVSSFAGYMSIERDFDQPNGLFYWFDVLGVSDLRPVIPNLGADNYQDVQTMGHFESDLTVDGTTTDYDYIVGRKLIPGTIRVKIQDKDNKKYELVDDGQGHFMAVAGVISSGEYDIAALGAMKKATGSDMATFLFTKLRELYTKCINGNLVRTLEGGYTGDVMDDLDLSNGPTGLADKFYDYRSRIDLFDSYLINVESALATKVVKGVNTTAYVAGNRAANQFQKGGVIGRWEKNTKMSYINDLLGWYNGIPVLRSTDVVEAEGEGTFYAIHKTPDGQMAPLARGIYMPLTDTPTVGNYANPTQMAAGIYYQEGTRIMAPELAQKVTFKLGI